MLSFVDLLMMLDLFVSCYVGDSVMLFTIVMIWDCMSGSICTISTRRFFISCQSCPFHVSSNVYAPKTIVFKFMHSDSLRL